MDAIQRTVLEGAAVWHPLKLTSVDRHLLKVAHELPATGDGHHLAYQTGGGDNSDQTQLRALYTPLTFTFTPTHKQSPPLTSLLLRYSAALTVLRSTLLGLQLQTHTPQCPEVLPPQLESPTSPEFVAQWIVRILWSREPPTVRNKSCDHAPLGVGVVNAFHHHHHHHHYYTGELHLARRLLFREPSEG